MVAFNSLSPAFKSKKKAKRVGRGMGSGFGKTCGHGHKGQKSRSGVSLVGFEGGQTPLYRRLPKSGFKSFKKRYVAKVRLGELNKISEKLVTLDVLKSSGIVNKHIKYIKIYLSGEIEKVIEVVGISVSEGARKAIEAIGGIVRIQ